MSDDRASPRPWRFLPEVDPAPMDAKGWFIVKGQVYGMAPADATLIVRAVNHHDELVAALDGLCDADADSDARYYHDDGRDSVCSCHGFGHFDTCPSEGCIAVRERLSAARALLARIKGKPQP